jgi:long-chain acyl-CoA synthetase
MKKSTITGPILDALRRYNRPDLLLYKRRGRWGALSSQAFLRQAASLAATLREAGVQKGDRVALFSENRPEWHIADLAILGLGAINVPLYPAESVERLGYILQHSEARVCFVSGSDQFSKVATAWDRAPQLETVIPFEPEAGGPGPSSGRVLEWKTAAREDTAEAAVAEFERLARSHRPDDVASLLYTSGTTGTPKGVLLTHDNFASQVATLGELLQYGPEDLAMSMLPLCHIYERTNFYVYMVGGCSIAYAESFDEIIPNMRELRPTLMAVVPRFFEKFYAALMGEVHAAPALKRRVFDWALSVGRQAVPFLLRGESLPVWLGLRYRLAEALVYSKLRNEIGGRMRCFISGAAPLSPELNLFFHALGLTIFEGYGLTETSPVIAVNNAGQVKLGTVGRPLREVEVKIAEDGEILTRGPHVMKGYYKMEEETEEVLRDGWFSTGDVGFLDEDGYLTVTDRKKDLIKTAGGKYVAPQPIENQLKQSPYISNAVVIGDRKRYAVALLVPNLATLQQYASTEGAAVEDPSELLRSPVARKALQAEVDKVNAGLAQYERLKRFELIESDFSFDEGLLTYTQKKRRRQIEERYRELIERLYDEEPRPA